MTRQELKTMFFQQDWSNVKERKQIIVNISKGPHWVGYGNIEILSDGPNGFCGFSTHQKFPLEYVKNCKQYKSGKYELIINGKKVDKI
jgi:hypothetical protein